MKKIFLIVLILSLNFSYADDIDYFEKIENNTLTIEEVASVEDEALALFLYAHFDTISYEYAEAYTKLEEALTLTEKDTRLEYEILKYMMHINGLFDNYKGATIKSLRMKEIAVQLNYTHGIIISNCYIAEAFVQAGDIETAREHLQEAYDLSMETSDQYGMLNYYISMWYLEYIEWDLEKAGGYLQEAKDIYLSNNLDEPIGIDLVDIESYFAFNDYWRDEHQEALDHLLSIEDLLEEDNLLQLSNYYYNIGFFSKEIDTTLAIESLNKAKELYGQVSKLDTVGYYENLIDEALAYAYYSNGDYQLAADYFYLVTEYYYSEAYGEEVFGGDEDLSKYKEQATLERIELLEQISKEKERVIELQKYRLYLSMFFIVLLIILIIVIIYERNLKNKSEKLLYRRSITDELTQVFNRGHIIDIFESKLEENNGVILLDIDNFKVINDTHGHVVGDKVLKIVAQLIKESVRETDYVGRYGGEEFLVVLEGMEKQELMAIAERIKESLGHYEWSYPDLETTCSIGVSFAFSKDSDEVLHHVDQLMYQAKVNGKNQVIFG